MLAAGGFRKLSFTKRVSKREFAIREVLTKREVLTFVGVGSASVTKKPAVFLSLVRAEVHVSTRKGGGGHTQGRDRKVRGERRTEIGSDAAMEWQESVTRDVLEEQAGGSGGRDSGVGVRVTRGQSVPRAVSVPTEGGGGRSRPAVEAEPAVPSLTRGTRAKVRRSSEASSPQQKSENEKETLEPPAGGVGERRQRRVTRSSQEFLNAAG